MSEKNTNSIIQAFTSAVYENSINQAEAEISINDIHAHFQEISQISGYDGAIENMAAIPAAKGKALGLNHAAQCLLDYKRTVKFLRAIVSVIVEERKKQPDKAVNVFYAGCGPYAPFVTLVAPYFKPEDVQFTLLEINKNSVESTKRLIDNLELNDYVNDIYVADAVTFKVPNADTFNILISETLDALLYRECYIPILFNMLPQFNDDIILIPENVLININFKTHSNVIQEGEEHDGGIVFDARESVANNPGSGQIPLMLPDKKIDLKAIKIETYEGFILDTKVHVYGDIWLSRNESSLTLPLNCKFDHPVLSSTMIFNYYMEPETQLNCRFE